MAKQICHLAGIEQIECDAVQEKCLASIKDIKTDADAKTKFMQRETEIKMQLKEVFETAEITAEEVILVFEFLDITLTIADELDCNSSKAEIVAAKQKLKKRMEAKFGEKLNKIQEAGEKFKNVFGLFARKR
jgi:hypothetical protein